MNFPVCGKPAIKNLTRHPFLEIDLKRDDDVYLEEMKNYDYTCRIKEAVRFSALESNRR